MTEAFLDLYFKRIEYVQSPRVDLPTLQDLHNLHLHHIPYENIDVFCHQGAVLDREALVRKMLLRQRGGYCFEQNGLFLAVLSELGFKCHPNMARVHRNRPQPGGRTHQVNLVALDGRTWLCDVGFGGSGFRHPLPLKSDVEFEQMGEIYRFREDPTHGYYLLKNVQQEWQPLYTFKIEAAMPIDIEMANFYTSNSSQHIFRDAIIGTRMTSQGRVTLRDHMFKRFDLTQGTVERETVTEFGPYLHNLENYLGVQLNEAERARLELRFPFLKPAEPQRGEWE